MSSLHGSSWIRCAQPRPLRCSHKLRRNALLDYESPTGNTRTQAIQLASGRYNIFQGGGVLYRCRGQDNTIIADSSEYYGDQSVLYLIGSVHYRETRAKVDSDRMTYYQLEDRLRAEGNVNVRPRKRDDNARTGGGLLPRDCDKTARKGSRDWASDHATYRAHGRWQARRNQ